MAEPVRGNRDRAPTATRASLPLGTPGTRTQGIRDRGPKRPLRQHLARGRESLYFPNVLSSTIAVRETGFPDEPRQLVRLFLI